MPLFIGGRQSVRMDIKVCRTEDCLAGFSDLLQRRAERETARDNVSPNKQKAISKNMCRSDDETTVSRLSATATDDEGHRGMAKELTNILVVDDNDDLRGMLGTLFSDYGYRVRTAEDGVSALAEMRSELPDVLISDLDMPRMSGFELLLVVRERFPEVKVIAMSGIYSGNAVPRGVAADAYYPKGGAIATCLPDLVKTVIGCDR